MRVRLLALPAIVVLAACGSPGSNGGTAAGGNSQPAVSVTLDAQNFRFSPALVTAKPGDTVAVTINNKDGFEHNFSISELKVNKDVGAGKIETVNFTATGSTNLQFFCEYHKSRGMVGTLGLGAASAPAAAPSAASTDKSYGSGY